MALRLWHSLGVGLFLGTRQLRRASLWSTLLIVMVMTLTFLNIVFVNGILIGLVQGSSEAFRKQYSGDVLIETLPTKNFIQNTNAILANLRSDPTVEAASGRYIQGGVVQANYKAILRPSDRNDEISMPFVGVDFIQEDLVTGLDRSVAWGKPLDPDDENGILVGSRLLSQYSNVSVGGDETLDNVEVGTKVRIVINGLMREMTVRGIVKSKIQEVSRRAYINGPLLRKLIGRNDYNVDEISVRLKTGANPETLKSNLIAAGFDEFSHIQTWEEAQGSFFKDITATFGMLGAVFGSIGLVVASITIFIVIFINAITRRKFIGILKGIGVDGMAIEISYLFQSLTYALMGSGVGFGLLFGILKPYFDRNPINFPFSDGVLVATLAGTLWRIGLILIATLIAGFIPARIVIKGNTLDAILGR